MPEFKDLKGLLSEKDIYEENIRDWDENLYQATKSLLDVGALKDNVISEAYRRAELKYNLDNTNKPERLTRKKKI